MSQTMKLMSFQIDEATAELVDALAERTGSDQQTLLREAVERYLNDAASWDAASWDAGILKAREDIRENRLYPAADVHAWVAKWGTAEETERPGQISSL
jgi:predicted transcriptional regulator